MFLAKIFFRIRNNFLVALVLYLLYKTSRKRKSLRIDSEFYKEAPVAKSTGNWIIFKFFGHVADFRPWECKDFGLVSLRLLQARFDWYQSVPGSESVRVRIIRDKYVFSKSLDLVEAICGKEDSIFRNSDTIRSSLGKLFPRSIVILTGSEWKRVRRSFVVALNSLDLECLPQSTFECLEQGFHLILPENAKEINLWDTFSCATFDSFMKFAYGIDFGTLEGKNMEVLNTLRELTKGCCDRMLVNWNFVWYLPFGTTPRLYKLRDELNLFILDHLRTSLKEYDRNPDDFRNKATKTLVEALVIQMKECTVKEKQVSEADVVSMLVAAMFGGFDTTTSSMSFICKALCENPDYQDKVYQEVKYLDFEKITKKGLDDLPMLNSFIKETQRLHAVAPAIARVPNRDVVVNNTLFTKGTNIILDTGAILDDPKNWNGMTDMNEFRPERFLSFTPAENVFNPFGFGARKCPGYKIAGVQIQTIVAYLVKNFKVSSGRNPISARCSLGVTVSSDSTVTLTRR